MVLSLITCLNYMTSVRVCVCVGVCKKWDKVKERGALIILVPMSEQRLSPKLY